jgi:hypothetical protein
LKNLESTTEGAGMTVIDSPCVNVCRLQGNLCLGCYRTLDEIAMWSQMSAIEKKQVLSKVANRSVREAENNPARPVVQKNRVRPDK